MPAQAEGTHSTFWVKASSLYVLALELYEKCNHGFVCLYLFVLEEL